MQAMICPAMESDYAIFSVSGAVHMEDGHLMDGLAFSWSSGLEGQLGMGRNPYFDDLTPGRPTLTLEVRDSDGFVPQESASSFVGRPVYLPLIMKRRRAGDLGSLSTALMQWARKKQ